MDHNLYFTIFIIQVICFWMSQIQDLDGLFSNGSAVGKLIQLRTDQILRPCKDTVCRLWKSYYKMVFCFIKLQCFLLRCCECLMWCFEKCMKFLNINAYIITGIDTGIGLPDYLSIGYQETYNLLCCFFSPHRNLTSLC